jgi:hypothetical protein
MAFVQQNDYDLKERVSFRVPFTVGQAIRAQAEREQKTVSEVLRQETLTRFRQKA